MLINAFTRLFKKLGLGGVPGDLRGTLCGREFFRPRPTAIILSLLADDESQLIQALEAGDLAPILLTRKGLP